MAVNGNGNHSDDWEEVQAAPYPKDLPEPLHSVVAVAIHPSLDYVCVVVPPEGHLLTVVPAEAWLEVADSLEEMLENDVDGS